MKAFLDYVMTDRGIIIFGIFLIVGLLILAYAAENESHPVHGKLVLSAWETQSECERELRDFDLHQLLPLVRTNRVAFAVTCAPISTQLRNHR